jgi:hypothetical protein
MPLGLTDSPNQPMASSSISEFQRTMLFAKCSLSADNSGSLETYATVSNNDSSPADVDLEIIAQPYYTSRLRSSAQCENEKRRTTLKAKGPNSSFKGPTIRVR